MAGELLAIVGATALRHKGWSDVEVCDTARVLRDTVVGLYFGSQSCSESQRFTASLLTFYNGARSKKNQLEVIFVSSDADAKAFQAYFDLMPWLAIPYDDARRTSLAQRFSVIGTPTLVFLDADGKTITTDGRAVVLTDPMGAAFAKTLAEAAEPRADAPASG
eukprot:EG_transcript_26102